MNFTKKINFLRVKMGSETVVILHGVEVIQEALTKPEFLGRPPNGPLKIFNDGSKYLNLLSSFVLESFNNTRL